MPVETSQPITTDQLIALWKSATDSGYHLPFIEKENSGIEAHGQAWEQYQRASVMVNRTTQAMFILPWSGQSDEPASGEHKATVTLCFTREEKFDRPVVLGIGTVIEHVAIDYSKDGAVEVLTGRRYLLTEDAVFLPGGAGPLYVAAEAERPGYGYNLPLPGTIRKIQQLGPGLLNEGADVIAPNRMILPPGFGDVITAAHVGQYIEFTAGANVGSIRLVIGFTPGDGTTNNGTVFFEQAWILTGTITGTFNAGEVVAGPGTSGNVLGVSGNRITILGSTGSYSVSDVVTGTISGATITIVVIEQLGTLTAETDAHWRVLPWDDTGNDDLGIIVTNEESPDGGRSPMLDELGSERGVYRSIGETDDVYRKRVATPADVVSPNAIIRSINLVLVEYGLSACFREVGTNLLPGLFFDAGSSLDTPQIAENNYAYDLDFTVRPADRFKLTLSFSEFRAFFLVGVPPLRLDDFGIPYDATNNGINAFDALVSENFYDGFPTGNAAVYSAIYNAILRAKAGGVGFELYVETIGCF